MTFAESLKLKPDLISQILEKQLSLRAARKLLNDTIVPLLIENPQPPGFENLTRPPQALLILR